jgi:hypothetical protein
MRIKNYINNYIVEIAYHWMVMNGQVGLYDYMYIIILVFSQRRHLTHEEVVILKMNQLIFH